MAAKKVGDLIKEARTAAGMTQEQLAKKAGVTASDISKAERGEKELTQEQLKKIAKATGVTQKSLLEAPSGSSAKTSSGSSASKTAYNVTAEEKKLIQYYRKADSSVQEQVMNLLKVSAQTSDSVLGTLLEGVSDSDTSSVLGSLISGAAELLKK